MNLKNTFILLATFLFSSLNGMAQFTQLNGPEGCFPNCFAKISTGILCGSMQNLYISPNEGRNWVAFSDFQGKQICSMLTSSDTIVLLYFSGIEVYDSYDSIHVTKSFDGGQTWPLDTLIYTYKIEPSLNRFGNKIIVSAAPTILESDDFGSTYYPINMPDGGEFVGSVFSNNFLYLVSFDSLESKHYISDTTLNFSRIDSLDQIQHKLIIDSLVFGYKWGPPGFVSIMKSEDRGITWNTSVTIDSTIFFFLRSADNLLYWVDRSNNYTVSSDFGITWTASPIPYQVRYQNRYTLPNGDELSFSNELYNLVHYIPSLDSAYLSCSGIKGQFILNLEGNSNVLYCTAELNILNKSETDGLNWDTINRNMSSIIVSGDSIFSTNLYFIRSYDRGITWQQGLNTGSSSNVVLHSPLIKINNRFYCKTSTNIFYSDDLGDNWTSLPPLPIISGCTTSSNFSGTLCAIGNDLIANTFTGGIFKFDPVTSSWTYLYCIPSQTNNSFLSNTTFVNNILISTTASTLYTSLDSGQTWNQSPLNGVPLDHRGTQLTPHSIVGRNGELIGCVRKNGIYTSSNNGIDWTPLYSNLPFESRNLTLINDRLYIGSEYQGIWRENTILGVGYISNSEKELSVYPNPTNGNINITMPESFNENILLKIYDLQGIFVKSAELESAETDIELENLSNGIYVGKLLSESGKINYQFKISIIK